MVSSRWGFLYALLCHIFLLQKCNNWYKTRTLKFHISKCQLVNFRILQYYLININIECTLVYCYTNKIYIQWIRWLSVIWTFSVWPHQVIMSVWMNWFWYFFLKIIGMCDVKLIMMLPIKIIMSVLNFLTYIMYVAQLVLSDLSSNTRDNVCLNFLNCRYSICISEHFAYFYNLYTDHCVYL